MSDQYVQIYPNSTGLKIDTTELTVGSNTVERQRLQVAGVAAAQLADVLTANPTPGTNYGLVVIPMNVAASSGIAPSQATVTSTASAVFSSTSTVQSVIVQNQSTVPVTVGLTSAVTAGTAGLVLAACQTASDGTGGSITFTNFNGSIYAVIVTGSATVGVQALSAT